MLQEKVKDQERENGSSYKKVGQLKYNRNFIPFKFVDGVGTEEKCPLKGTRKVIRHEIYQRVKEFYHAKMLPPNN